MWLIALVVTAMSVGGVGAGYDSSLEIPDSDSADGFTIVDEHFGGVGSGLQGTIAFEAPQGIDDPEVESAIAGLIEAVRANSGSGQDFESLQVRSPYDPRGEHQVATTGPRAGQIAYATLSLPQDTDQFASSDMGTAIEDLAAERGLSSVPGLRLEVGGAPFGEFPQPSSELIGLAFAVVILIVAIGSVVAMGTTIGVAIAGVAIGGMGIALVSNATTVPEFATTIGVMIGLGVGIDYTLFIVTRYREALAGGHQPVDAAGLALATAGRAVLFAGATVVVSLAGLLLVGLGFMSGLGIAAAVTVTVVMAASTTLLPAALGLVKDRIGVTRRRGVIAAGLVALALVGMGLQIAPFMVGLPLAVIVVVASYLPFAGPRLKKTLPPRRQRQARDTVSYRWSRAIQARPWTWALVGTVAVVALAAPVASLRLGFSDEGNWPEGTRTRQAFDLLAEGFGPGSNGPLLVATELRSPDDLATLEALSATIADTPGVASVSPPRPDNPDTPQAALIQIVATSSPQDVETEDLVHALRDDIIPTAVAGTDLDPKVTGTTAANIDFSQFLAGRMPIFFGIILALSFVLLTVVFRSLLVPLKAVLLNMASIAASYGVVVAIFQWGWLGNVIGVEPAPIEPFIPVMMFAIVFGLSMDYEVFLLSRIKEEYDRTGDAANAVADGLAKTARLITAAAAIMVVVFASFVFEDGRLIKLMGIGLATAVLVDATLVRMILVPSTMQLLGARNWWLPNWLDRTLPHLTVEAGTDQLSPPAPGVNEGPPSGIDDDEPALV